MPLPAPVSAHPHRLSQQSTASSASLSSSSSSFHPPSSSSSSNGRLTPASERLSIQVPPNARFLSGGRQGQRAERAGGGGVSEGEHREEAEGAEREGEEWVDADEEGGEALREGRPGEQDAEEEEEESSASSPRNALPPAVSWVDESSTLAPPVDPELGAGLGISMPFPSSSLPPTSELPPYAPSPSSSPSDRPAHGQHPSDSTAASSSAHSARPSTLSASSSLATGVSSLSGSSSLSLPTAPMVDVGLPQAGLARPGGTYVSTADSRLASLAAANAPSSRNNSQSGARSFFSSLLSRSPRSHNSQSPRFSPSPSPSTSPNPSGPPRSPSAPLGWQYQHPSVTSLQSSAFELHSRSTSMPNVAGVSSSPAPRDSSDLYRPPVGGGEGEAPQRRTPRAIAAATFAGLTRSASLGGGGSSAGRNGSPRLGGLSSFGSSTSRPAPSSHISGTASPVPTIGFATPPLPSASTPGGSAAPEQPTPTLAGMGLGLVPLTQPLSLSRNGQPLCGALLDNKYLLIGTTTGLDFLPLPLPGSLPMKQHGTRKRKETRKPIALIKRTRFKELAVLSERSNILLAIAGRNDHIRVYALDGIRSMIEKKMQELDMRDGYPVVLDEHIFDSKGGLGKGKGKAAAPPPPPPSFANSSTLSPPPASSTSRPVPAGPPPSYQFPPASSSSSAAAPDYTAPAPSPRRRPPSWHQAQSNHLYGAASPSSPVRISSRTTPTSATFVRAVSTNPSTSIAAANAPRHGSVSSQTTVVPPTPTAANGPTARSLRGQKSREFIAGRKGSTATMHKRRSRADLQTPPLPGSRRSSLASRRGSTRGGRTTDGGEDADEEPMPSLAGRLSMPSSSSSAASTARRPSVLSESGWVTETSLPGAIPSPMPRPRSRMEPRAPIRPQNPLERSPTSDLADFLRDSGPEMHSPEMDTVLASTRGRRRSSITDNLLQVAKDAHLFPSSSTGVGAFTSAVGAGARPGLARAVTTSHLAGLALYADNADGGTDELVEMLQESSVDPRRASLNDFRRASVGGTALQPRAATSPRQKQGERSPALELAELLRETGPEEGLPSRRFSSATVPFSRPAPREATTPRLGAGQKSPSMELAELLQETGPSESSSPEQVYSTPPLEQSSSFSNPFATARPTSGSSFGSKGKAPASAGEGGAAAPPTSAGPKLVPRSPVNLGAAADDSTDETDEGKAYEQQQRRKASLTLAEAIRAGPPTSSSTSAAPASTGLGISSTITGGGSSPGNRSSKRWTMSGVGSLLSRPRSTSQSSAPATAQGLSPARPSSSASNRTNGNVPRSSLDSRTSSSSPWEMVPEQPAGPPLPQPAPRRQPDSSSSRDYKRRPTSSLHRQEPLTLPVSSQIPPDAHPANSASPLEYVKLARTKGARLLRAVETKKRTYLAVLCGEEAERIELFTGSRSISLSLNRTFVLPETPRTVEFQLQGDDLVDIYLVYGESIFALEPATVRVREVGVGRGERRARRERERRMRNLAATSRDPIPEDPAAADEVRSAALHSALHPADPALREQEQRQAGGDSQTEGEDTPVPPSDREASRSPSPAPASEATRSRTVSAASRLEEAPPPAFPADEFPRSAPAGPASGPPPFSQPASSSSTTPEDTRSSTSRSKSLPYSTFQQLAFVPPVPSLVLSSSWTIPPLYTDVVAGSPAPSSSPSDTPRQPAITVTGENGAVSAAAELTAAQAAAAAAASADLPLLSPISLLGGAALRQNGPPGLFFVSKGKNLSGIVTADGKSIIKRPLVWSHDRQEPLEPNADVPQRIEVLVVAGKRTVVVKLSSTDVKAISVDGFSAASPFSPALTVSPSHPHQQPRPSIQFLATHSPSQQLLFAQTSGSSSYSIQCLSATSS